MAKGLRPLKLLGKWIAVPVALSVIGYYIVGPRVSSRVSPQVKQLAGEQFAMLNNRMQKMVAEAHPKPTPPPSAAVTPTSQRDTAPNPPNSPSTDSNSTTQPQAASDTGGPEVEVSVHAPRTSHRFHRHVTAPSHRRPRRHHVRVKPKPGSEATDEGSFGGTQDQPPTSGGDGNPPSGQ